MAEHNYEYEFTQMVSITHDKQIDTILKCEIYNTIPKELKNTSSMMIC